MSNFKKLSQEFPQQESCANASVEVEKTLVYSALSDERLTDLFRTGDRRAFEQIYNRYWSVIYSHVYRMLRDEDDSKDVVQEVFTKLWLGVDKIKSNNNISGLLYVAARRRIFNLIEHKRVRNDYVQSIADFMTVVDPNTVDQVDEKQLRTLIAYEIQNLPPKMREIFELSRNENLSHKEIAKQLNISDQTVKKQVKNALKIIKPKLSQYEALLLIMLLSR